MINFLRLFLINLFGLASLLWLLFRTVSKPTRMSYPCQQASAASGSLWIASYVKAPVRAILDHPHGFSGEVIIADNGQGQFGSTGHGGSLSYARNNAENITQSMQSVDSMDPDNKSPGSFGDWLHLSSAEIAEAGHLGAADEKNINVYLD